MMLLGSVTAVEAQSFMLRAELKGMSGETPMTVSLGCTHKEEKPLASGVCGEGVLELVVPASGPRMYVLATAKGYGGVSFMAAPGDEVRLVAEVSVDSVRGEVQYRFSAVKVTGSPLQDEYLAKVPDREELNRMYEAFHEKYKDFVRQRSEAYAAGDTLRLKALAESGEAKALAADEKAFFDRVQHVVTEAVTNNKETFWGPLLLMDQMNYLTEKEGALYQTFSAEAKNSFYGQLAAKEIWPPTVVGRQMPDFTAADSETGAETRFRCLCRGKRAVLLDFWASWCNPCRKEIPNLKKLYALYKEKGFEIISVSADTREADWRKALNEEELTWPNFRDTDKSIQQAYEVKFYPTMYVLDGDGHCLAENLRGEKLAEFLSGLFE